MSSREMPISSSMSSRKWISSSIASNCAFCSARRQTSHSPKNMTAAGRSFSDMGSFPSSSGRNCTRQSTQLRLRVCEVAYRRHPQSPTSRQVPCRRSLNEGTCVVVFDRRGNDPPSALRYWTEAADTRTKPRVLFSLSESWVFMASRSSDAFTHTGGYLYRATSRMRKRSAYRHRLLAARYGRPSPVRLPCGGVTITKWFGRPRWELASLRNSSTELSAA